MLGHQPLKRRSTGCQTEALSRSCPSVPAVSALAIAAGPARSAQSAPERKQAPPVGPLQPAFPTSPATATCTAGRSRPRAARPYRAPSRSVQKHRAGSPVSARPSSAVAPKPAQQPRSDHSYDRSYDHSNPQQPHRTPRHPSTKGQASPLSHQKQGGPQDTLTKRPITGNLQAPTAFRTSAPRSCRLETVRQRLIDMIAINHHPFPTVGDQSLRRACSIME